MQNQAEVRSVSLIGTFNEWKDSKEWQFEQKLNEIWELQVPAKKVCIPGNSGFAEFKFLVNESNEVPLLPQTPQGYKFKNNYIIIFPETDIEKNIKNEKTALQLKNCSNFNFANEDDRKTIANFRLVPGTKTLFRSYNPCDSSKPNDGEVDRLTCVNEFIESNSIQSIISLSGFYEPSDEKWPTPYVQKIIDRGHFLAIEPSYESVYYKSDSVEFAKQFKLIVRFITIPANKAPFLVHCKIGTDRTGVVSAIFAALCGASWKNISIDYQKSNEVGFEEYRDVKLLQYSLENMLKTKITADLSLKRLFSNYFIKTSSVSAKEIELLQAKLCPTQLQ